MADNHYSLAQEYGEAPSKEKEREDGVRGIVAALSGGGSSSDGGNREGMSPQEIAQCLVKSMEHYLACGVSFAGYLATMCGVDAAELTNVENEVPAVASIGGGSRHSKTLEVIRSRVAELKPGADVDMEKFHDTKEILDEIQEALDTAEGSEDALKTVHAMKENEIRKHSGKSGEEVVDENGATTTIGFGNGSTGAMSGATMTAGFGSSDKSSTAAVAPMMVVKKKKKPSVSNDDGGDAKRAKSE